MSDYLFFDEVPTTCPGCGTEDHPERDGPSYLMIRWMPLVKSYLCIDCVSNWSTWESRQSPGCKYPDDNSPPLVVKNLELIAKGQAPSYVKD